MMRITLAAALLAASAVPATAAEMVFFETVRNTDVASFGMGYLRGVGTGSLTVSGLSGTVTKAYLFWHGPTSSTDDGANATVSFGGSSVTGVNIGFSDDNFWSLDNSQAYRADVTSLVTGNGAYAIANFRKSTDIEINGLSLIVFFDDGDSTNNVDVALFNGNDANFPNIYDADNWNATLNGINYSGGSASLVLHVSDGQNFGPADDGTLTVNGTALGTGGLYQGDGVQFGDGTFPSNGALWDIESFDITSLLVPGVNNLTLSQNAVNDALSLIVAQFNLPVGSAPDPTPAPAALGLFGIGLGMIAARRRRRS
jgi:hypothetical protein